MKKLLLFLVLYAGIANAQVINFTDANLKSALIAPNTAKDLLGNAVTTIDTNSDGDITVAEALNISMLNIDSKLISNLGGLENFANLKDLSCDTNQITTFTGTPFLLLENLILTNNQLTFLNISGSANLTFVNYNNNPNLAHVDVSGCPGVLTVNISSNALTYLDVSNSGVLSISATSANLSFLNFDGCQAMTGVNLWNSQLTGLNFHDLSSLNSITVFGNAALSNLTVTNCPLMNYFYSSSNNLTSLDVSTMPALVYLYCPDNQFTTLDVSSLFQLDELVLDSNTLQTLYMKNGRNESTISLSGANNLTFICADESQIGAVQAELNAQGLTSTVCNSYCNFTPGGSYNTIIGSMKLDSNNNGCDAADVSPVNMRVDINDGTNTNTAFVNTNGAYRLYTQAGNFSIIPSVENPSYFNFSPATDSAVFPDNLFNTAIKNFCVTSVGSHQDLEVVIAPITWARPGFDATYWIVYKNKGNEPISAANGITLAYNDNLIDFVSASTPASTSGVGSLTWDYANLLPFESRSILVTMHIHAPTDTNPVNVGNLLQFGCTILPAIVDENLSDNTFPYSQTVVGSYDPNNIACIEGDVVSPTEIGDYLHYIINFENTGTHAAENVVVKTVIDPLQFDLNSLQLMNASNEVEARITGNVVEFIFENIQLGIGGHGHILLKIKTNNALLAGDTVSKKADIFFDYNFPVDTGLANTTFQLLKAQDFETDASIGLQPNPTSGMIAIKADNAIKNVQVYDVQGRLLEAHLEDNTQSKLDISAYPKGIYFVKIFTQNGVKTEKVIRK